MSDTVSMWEQDLVIPTYPAAAPDRSPMFVDGSTRAHH